jgi:enamine deaminase RidA (YjgF/YER057c/UK114 family)
MTTNAIDLDRLAPIPGSAHYTVSTVTRIVHISGQTGVDADDRVVGPTFLEQATQAFRNLKIAAENATGTTGPIPAAMLRMYVVDYSASTVEDLITAAVTVFGEDYPITASTLLGVACLWRPELLFEVDAVLVLD